MKTFEEACRALFIRPANTPEESARAIQSVATELQRYHALVEEIQRSPLTRVYIMGMIHATAQDVFDVDSAMLSVFASGVIVGIEMERGELVAGDSVPGRRERPKDEPPPAPGSFTSI